MTKHIALKNAFNLISQLGENEEVDKCLVLSAATPQENTVYNLLDVYLCATGPFSLDEPSIIVMRFNRIFIAEYAAKAIAISENLHNLEIPGKVELKTRKDKDGASETIIEAFYTDITERQFYAIIEAYLSAINSDDEKINVEVTEEQGDYEDTKIQDEGYTIFYADGTHEAYPRYYPGFY